MPLNRNTLYNNEGNQSVLQYIDGGDRRILDVGCGAGSNGRLIQELYPSSHVTGITCSQSEYDEAKKYLSHCIYADLEKDDLSFEDQFDVLLFCHVLEHLVDPVSVIKKLLPYLKKEGKIIILVPNIATWRERWKLALGRFEYTESGIMDKTHLHFYTFYTACRYLVDPIPQLKKLNYTVKGSVPLGPLRHYFLNQNLRKMLDEYACSLNPNLFGNEIIIDARKTESLSTT